MHTLGFSRNWIFNAFSQTLGTSLLSSLIFLGGCSNPSKPEIAKAPEPQIEVTPIAPPTVIEAVNPAQERQMALEGGDWLNYLRLSNDIWQESSDTVQQEIEQQVWRHLQRLDTQTLITLQASEPDIQAWADLALMMRADDWQQQAKLNLETFHASAPFHRHLYEALLATLPKEQAPKFIAIFLPETGKYQLIGEFIKNGILKSYYQNANQQTVRLKFYDSADLSQVLSLYYQAKSEGADFIIGPVQKEAIELLSSLDDPNILALNSLDTETVFSQYNLRDNHAEAFLLAAIESQNYQNLAIFGSDNPKQQQAAEHFANAWQRVPTHNVIRQTYSEADIKFREALGKLVNENASIERKNTLRWIVGKPLDFFPRVRQDLDAILMLDKAQNLSVFNPQFNFYQLPIDVYAEDALRPKAAQQIKPMPDLAGIRLLNPPFALNPENLTNMFEAFGWDAWLLATQMHKLKTGGCLTAAKTGILSMDDYRVNQQLIWTQYDYQGVLRPYQFPTITPLLEQPETLAIESNDAPVAKIQP